MCGYVSCAEAIVKPISLMDCVELVLEQSEDGQMSLIEQKRLPGENNVSLNNNYIKSCCTNILSTAKK